MMKVPIYYTNLLPQEKRYMISRDATSSLAEYAIMAINYNGMNKIVDVMEITKDHARKRKIKRSTLKKISSSTLGRPKAEGRGFSQKAAAGRTTALDEGETQKTKEHLD